MQKWSKTKNRQTKTSVVKVFPNCDLNLYLEDTNLDRLTK